METKICKDCIHYELCNYFYGILETTHNGMTCSMFKDKDKFIELPCAIGDYCMFGNSLYRAYGFTYIGDDYDTYVMAYNVKDCTEYDGNSSMPSKCFKFISDEEAKKVWEELNV